MKSFDNTTPHLSSVYDDQILNTVPNYDCFHRETVDIVCAAGIEPRVWLDTGAGTGTLVSICLDLFPKTLFLIADPSAEMLTEAKEKLCDFGTDRVRILEPSDSQSLKLPDDLRPDVITAIQSHHYLSAEEREAATKNCYDMLSPGGIFITFENTRPFSETGIEIAKRKWGRYQESRGKTKEQVEAHLARFDKEYFPISIEEHHALYRSCGFKTVELLWYSYMQAGFYCLK
jgi:tRNA (cmo5U34)-methyltransferase